MGCEVNVLTNASRIVFHQWLKSQLLEPAVHFLEMEIERAEFFEFAGLEMFCHDNR
jgi:hypothetical protein